MATRYRLKHHQLAAELAKSRRSQNAWAQALGLGRGHLSLLVNGKRPYPSQDTRRKLTAGLKVPFSTLFEVEEIPMPGSDRPRHLAWLGRRVPKELAMPLDSTVSEIRYALRSIVQRPLFSATIIVMLALGIGGNTAMFSWMDGLLLRPLLVEQPERWVQLGIRNPSGFVSSYSYPNFIDHRDLNDAFDEIYAYRMAAVSFSTGDGNARATAQLVSGAFFRALGVNAFVGRVFNETEDEVPGEAPVAVISHGFWVRHFAADRGAVGSEVLVNAQPFTIVGVTPPNVGFARAEAVPDLWVPLVNQEVVRPGSDTLENRGSGFLQVNARIRPGLDFDGAAAQINDLHARLAESHPELLEGTVVHVRPATRAYLGDIGDALGAVFAVLMAVIGAVLLIACINVANLMLARGADRRSEIAVRVALGASRGRIVKQLLTESLLLSGFAAALGVGFAHWITQLILSIQPPVAVAFRILVGVDSRVLVFTSLVAIATGLLFGTIPALRAAGTNIVSSIHGTGRVASGNKLRNTLVVAQITVSLALLIAAALFVRSLQNATSIDPGFHTDSVVVAALDPSLQGYGLEETRAFYRELLDRMEASPVTESVGLAEMLPMSFSNQQWGTGIEGYEPADNERMNLDYNYVSPGYFTAMQVALVAGRDFEWADTAEAEGVIIVNQTMADRYWPDGSALGGRVRSGGMDRTVVGIVADAKYYTLGEDPMPYMYFPYLQSTQRALALHVRSDRGREAVVAALRDDVKALDSGMPIFDIRTLDSQLSLALLPARLTATLLAAFGSFALLLAAVGLYGTMAYAVGQRTREIGIRMALGAAETSVRGMVIRGAGILLGIGAAGGILGGLGLGRAAEGTLYGVGWADPAAIVGALATIAVTVLAAAWLPARRAARVNPVDALRAD